jgi:hypothetical protein
MSTQPNDELNSLHKLSAEEEKTIVAGISGHINPPATHTNSGGQAHQQCAVPGGGHQDCSEQATPGYDPQAGIQWGTGSNNPWTDPSIGSSITGSLLDGAHNGSLSPYTHDSLPGNNWLGE